MWKQTRADREYKTESKRGRLINRMCCVPILFPHACACERRVDLAGRNAPEKHILAPTLFTHTGSTMTTKATTATTTDNGQKKPTSATHAEMLPNAGMYVPICPDQTGMRFHNGQEGSAQHWTGPAQTMQQMGMSIGMDETGRCIQRPFITNHPSFLLLSPRSPPFIHRLASLSQSPNKSAPTNKTRFERAIPFCFVPCPLSTFLFFFPAHCPLLFPLTPHRHNDEQASNRCFYRAAAISCSYLQFLCRCTL